jgi:3-methyladenine DNA glycosylase AlkD
VKAALTDLDVLGRALRAEASADHAVALARFFQTGPGGYGEGDRFLGVKVPALRRLAARTDGLPEEEVLELLQSGWHEERLLALLILVRRFQRGNAGVRERIHARYLASLRWVNNWDLVDLTAPAIVGGWLLDRDRSVLDRLAASASLWERRVAIIATLAFIREDEFAETLRLCELLRRDAHDLIQKACGWMLREVGKRDEAVMRRFLDRYAPELPRTMLRYAIERLAENDRLAYLRLPRNQVRKCKGVR